MNRKKKIPKVITLKRKQSSELQLDTSFILLPYEVRIAATKYYDQKENLEK